MVGTHPSRAGEVDAASVRLPTSGAMLACGGAQHGLGGEFEQHAHQPHGVTGWLAVGHAETELRRSIIRAYGDGHTAYTSTGTGVCQGDRVGLVNAMAR
jgi:hypothetical protein